MSVLKRITAGLTALSLTALCTGCKNVTTAMTIGDYVVPAGVYLYYLNTAYQNALSQLKEDNADLDTTDIKTIKATPLEGKDVRTWCEDKAIEYCTDFVATEKKFEELGLELDDATKSNIDSIMEYYWSSYETTMTENGISQESFKKIMTSSYKSEQIFEYYYAVGGEEGVTEDELKQYYIDNNIRAQYISFDLHDSEGNLLKSDGKAEVKKLAEGYQKRVETAYASGGAEAVMSEMDAVKEDYDAYKESVSAAEAEAAAAESETAAEAETTIEETAAALNAPNLLTAEEVSSPETTEDTTEEETSAETSAEEETAESSAEEETAESSAEEETAESFAEEETAESSAEEETAESSAEEETAESSAEEVSEIPVEEDDDFSDEEVLLAEEETTAKYQNESIISVINKEDYDDEETIYYTPDETVYHKLLEIKEADYGKIYFIEEDESYYLVVRYDITQRMTEDDLWTENTIESMESKKYYKDFEAKMDDWSAALTVTRNAAAFRRYDPYKYHFE